MTPLMHLTERCTECEHPVSAVSPAHLVEAMGEHVHYVNTQLDRATDPHFALIRLTGLCVQ